MTSEISAQIHRASEHLAQDTGSAGSSVGHRLVVVLNQFLGWPFRAACGRAVDSNGRKSPHFAAAVYTSSDDKASSEPVEIPADALACVIDVCDCIGLDELSAAYARIAAAKALRKSPTPHLDGATNATLGIIFASTAAVPLEDLAEELDRLNRKNPNGQWPDMLVVLSKGTISYAVQFPCEGPSGDYLPPADGAPTFTPPMYIVLVIKPAASFAFNKMCAVLFAHLAIFSPGACVPKWTEVLRGVTKDALTVCGYQYDLAGQLRPVAPEFYNGRYVSPRPVHVEDQEGRRLGTLQFLPWQDGGVVLLQGQLPLEGLLIFLGKDVFKRAGIVRRGDMQLSYALPITHADFADMLGRLQRQSNMILRTDSTSFVVQKLSEEGSSAPFMARIFLGISRLRDSALPDRAKRQDFDKGYEFVLMTLLGTQTTARQIVKLLEDHSGRVARGEVARIVGPNLHIDETIDKELRRQTEDFLNSSVRVLKQGMQEVAKALDVEIGFLFKKLQTFTNGIAVLRASDPELAEYLLKTREWSERLVESRNALEHAGSVLPRVRYEHIHSQLRMEEPYLAGQPVSKFITTMIDRLTCFVEEVTAHCLQKRLPEGISITELPPSKRDPDSPARFRLSVKHGGLQEWVITYHQSAFVDS
ncbi:MAG TPA: hypothetical protein VN862_02285 [Candidatus Acidoferrales bacterium]|nr:hypothetical protein [Candidatus Acidoferrales bacterium]